MWKPASNLHFQRSPKKQGKKEYKNQATGPCETNKKAPTNKQTQKPDKQYTNRKWQDED